MAALTKAQLGWHHPLYDQWLATWVKLRAAYEGSGGFQDGLYLVAHPREWTDHTATTPIKPTKKLLARRQIARYENWAELIVQTIQGALTRVLPTRQVGASDAETPEPIETWWADVDGAGTEIDDWMSRAWVAAAVLGHCWIALDRAEGVAATQADASPIVLRLYTALDVVDWTEDRGILTGVKAVEAAPRLNLDVRAPNQVQYRVWDRENWALYDQTGKPLGGGPHGFGAVPVVYLPARPQPFVPRIGRSVLKDPALFIDLYNLTSEIRELLRNQTFALLNIPLGTGDQAISVTEAKAQIGEVAGTANVLFSANAAQFVEPSGEAVRVYLEERQILLRSIFRLASLKWESDSKGVEAEGSLKIKREDLAQQLSAYADECERAEYAIADLWYHGTFGDRADREWDRAEPIIRYPDSFDPTPFDELLTQAQAALALEFPPEFWSELQQRLVTQFLPDLPDDKLGKIRAAVEAFVSQRAKEKEQRATLMESALRGGMGREKQAPGLVGEEVA